MLIGLLIMIIIIMIQIGYNESMTMLITLIYAHNA